MNRTVTKDGRKFGGEDSLNIIGYDLWLGVYSFLASGFQTKDLTAEIWCYSESCLPANELLIKV